MTLLNIPPADERHTMTALNAGADQESKAVEAKPNLSALPAVEQDSGGQVLEFTGLDLREKAGGGAYLECSNVSTRNYPCLSPRIGRAYRGEKLYQGVDDLFRFDKHTVFRRGTSLFFDSGSGPVFVGTVEDSPKKFAVINTKLAVFPDAVCLDLVTGKFTALDAKMSVTDAAIEDNRRITGTFYDRTGTQTGSVIESDYIYERDLIRVPYYDTQEHTEKHMWEANVLDTLPTLAGKYIVPGGENLTYNVLYAHFAGGEDDRPMVENTDGVVAKVTGVRMGADSDGDRYAVITAEVIMPSRSAQASDIIRAGDVVFIGGLVMDGREVDGAAFRVWDSGSASIDLGVNALFGYTVRASGLTIERRVPALDYVCASSNRLWGVSNAVENTVLDDDGNPVKFNGRAVFCSKLGDPANWYYYQGVSMDSWTAAVASEGDFTGICAWSDDILCFKEREMFRITGSQPSSYTLFSFSVPGVEQGSGGSIAIIDEVVYYKNEWGVYRYSGGTPTRVSENVSDALMGAGNAGTDGRNYFLSTPGGIYVYDTWHNAWAKHDTAVGRFAWDGGTVLFLDQAKRVSRVDGGGTDEMPWSVTLHPDYGTTSTGYYSYALNMGYKYYKYVFLRGELLKHNPDAEDPYVVVSAKMGDAPMREIGRQEGAGKFVLRMPVKRLREDCIQLKMDGSGDCVLRDIRYVYGTGSEWVQKDKGVM